MNEVIKSCLKYIIGMAFKKTGMKQLMLEHLMKIWHTTAKKCPLKHISYHQLVVVLDYKCAPTSGRKIPRDLFLHLQFQNLATISLAAVNTLTRAVFTVLIHRIAIWASSLPTYLSLCDTHSHITALPVAS